MSVSDVTHRPRLYSKKSSKTNSSKNPEEKQKLKELKHKNREARDNLVLWKAPIKTPYYFLLEAFELLTHYIYKLLTSTRCIATIISLAMVYYGGKQVPALESTISAIQDKSTWGLYWVILGVLSSVGLGTGLHTFLLYLGPHIAKVTMAAYECHSTDFKEPPYPNEMVCPDTTTASTMAVTIFTIMAKVRFEAFMWGAGTALGELPPYFMARAARLAGQQENEDSDDDDDDDFKQEMKEALEEADTSTMFGKGKQFMHDLVNKAGFFGILVAASIPNPLFDLAGITCGHFLIPFWTFFGATLIGKAVVKMHIQMVFIIFLFSKHHIQSVVSYLPTNAQDTFTTFLDKQSEKFHNPTKTAEEQDANQNFIKQGFEIFVLGMVAYFVMSIVHSMAQNQLKKQQSKSK